MDYQAEVHKAGRITIPVDIRRALNIADGDILTIRYEKDELQIITAQQAVERACSLLAPYLANASVDDFIAWKAEEVRKEEQDNG